MPVKAYGFTGGQVWREREEDEREEREKRISNGV